MKYIKTKFINDETALTAEYFNKLEDTVEELCKKIDEYEKRIKVLEEHEVKLVKLCQKK